MASPFRVYNFVHRIFKTETSQLINLNKVSSIELKNKCIKFTLDEKEPIFGFIMMIVGGGSVTKHVYCSTNEEAKKEFEDIQKYLEQVYKK
jgi:hypothetical protein